MKAIVRFLTTARRLSWLLSGILVIVSAAAIIVACGKLSDDSEQPYTPSGSSGGQTIPQALPSELGSFKITLNIDGSEVPADGVSYVDVQGKLTDSSGGSLENYIMRFETLASSSDGIGMFTLPPAIVGESQTLQQSVTGRTHAGGTVSVRFYGVQSGSCVLQVSVDIDGNGTYTEGDLFKTGIILITGGPGVPGPGIAGLKLTTNKTYETGTLGDCTDPSPATLTFNFTAKVWDLNGDPAVGARVELSGDGISDDLSNSFMNTGTNGEASFSISYTIFSVGTYTFTITGTTYIEGQEYTDEIVFYGYVDCDVPEATPTPAPTTLTVTLTAPTIPTGATTTPVTIVVLDETGAPMTTPVNINLTATVGTFSVSNPVSVTGTRTITLDIGAVAPRPASVVVYGSVTTSGYTGNGNVTITVTP